MAGGSSSPFDFPEVDFPFPLDRRKFTVRLRLRMPSTSNSIDRAVDETVRLAGECGCEFGSEDQSNLEIAMREALANAVMHGNEGIPQRDVTLRVYGSNGHGMIIAIRDEGEGFDPGDVPDPTSDENLLRSHGRGLFLMRKLMDHVIYLKGGREVVLFKACNRDE